jgi:hypothetical protein
LLRPLPVGDEIPSPKGAAVSAIFWLLLAVVYIVVLITLGVATLRKGHLLLFIIGIIFPLAWVLGALIGPSPRAASGRS